MRDYKLGKIYKLHILGNDDLIYYGSTIQSLSVRLAGHRKEFKRWKAGKTNFTTSFKLLECEGVVITLVEKYPCNSKYELEARERFYIENNKCVNKVIPTRTKKEYNKEYQKTDKYKQYKKEYNKEYEKLDKRKQYKKEYQKTDEYKQYKKEYNKEYEKLDKRKQYKKQYRKANADKLKQKIKCEFCGCSVGKNNLKRHQRTKKCKKFQNTISSP